MPAGRGQVGQLSIRVLPDTRKFKEDLRKALKRIERTVSATVQVGAELSRESALKLKREIAALDAEMKVKATVDDADEALRELGVDGARPPLDLARSDPAGYLAALARASQAAALTSGGPGGFLWALRRVG